MYSKLIKAAIYLAALGLIIWVLKATVAYLDKNGYDRAQLENAKALQAKDKMYGDKIRELRKASEATPEPVTVTETIEVIKYVDKVVENTEYVLVCDDLGDDYIRMRNDLRSCIFESADGGRECLQ